MTSIPFSRRCVNELMATLSRMTGFVPIMNTDQYVLKTAPLGLPVLAPGSLVRETSWVNEVTLCLKDSIDARFNSPIYNGSHFSIKSHAIGQYIFISLCLYDERPIQ